MLKLLRSPNLQGPWWIICLVAIFGMIDMARGHLGINLGAFPKFYKMLYIQVLVYQFGAIGSSEAAERSWNRRQRRAFYFGVPQRARHLYYDVMAKRIGAVAVAGGAVTIRGARSGLFWKQTPGALPVITDATYFSGNVFFVDSNTNNGGTTAGYGLHPDSAFTDLESAIDSPVYASQGDAVFMLPGHVETVTDEITVDVAGVSILGLGHGTARPTFTQNVAGDCIALDAANCVLDNVMFNEATTAPGTGGAAVDIVGASCVVSNGWFDLGADDLEAITITATGDFAEIFGCTFNVTANGPDAGIEIEAVVTELYIHNNRFLGMNDTNAWDVGGINSASAHTQCQVSFNDFIYGPSLIFSAAATGMINNNLFAEGTLGSMLDPGSCMCHENYEADAIDQSARLIPTTVAS